MKLNEEEFLVVLLNEVWLRDIPQPTSPEGREFHRKMQEIMNTIERRLEEVAK